MHNTAAGSSLGEIACSHLETSPLASSFSFSLFLFVALVSRSEILPHSPIQSNFAQRAKVKLNFLEIKTYFEDLASS